MSAYHWRKDPELAKLGMMSPERKAELEAICYIPTHQAFDALLAVAKAADGHLHDLNAPGQFSTVCGICEALRLLTQSHSGWRDWTA